MADTTFTNGVTLTDAGWFQDVNDQTYQTGTTATTFTWDGSGGTSGSVTLAWKKMGSFVMLTVPAVSATSGTGSTILVSNTALAASVRPAATQYLACNALVNNGASIASAGVLRILTSGVVYIQRDNALSTFTNTSSCGTSNSTTVCYYIG